MKFEKLNENKLRITLNIGDLATKNIDYQSFMSNSIDTQKLFLDMLDEAEKKVGFTTKNYKIMIEALVTSNGDFIVTVTRYLPEDVSTSQKKKVFKPKRKITNSTSTKLIYSFNTFDDFCLFCNSLDNSVVKNINKISKDISLYLYKNTYFLLVNDINNNFICTKSFINCISEFGTYMHNSNILEYELKEYAKPIISNNAVKICLKYFK